MYTFEEILFGNKSELLKQAENVKVAVSTPFRPTMTLSTTGNIGTGTATGNQATKEPQLNSPVDSVASWQQMLFNPKGFRNQSNIIGPNAGKVWGVGTDPHLKRMTPNGIVDVLPNGTQLTPEQSQSRRAITGGVGRAPTEAEQRAYANAQGVDYRGDRTAMPLAPGENYEQHAEKYLNNWYNNLDPQAKRGAPLLAASQWKGPYGAQLSTVQQGWATNTEPQFNANQYLSSINAGNNPMLQDIRQRNQRDWGNQQWNAMVDAQTYADKQRMDPNSAYNQEKFRQAKIRQDAINNRTRQTWQDQYVAADGNIENMERFQAHARNMHRIHDKAWAARGFTDDQINDFIRRDFEHKMNNVGVKRKPDDSLDTTSRVTAQSVAPQESTPAIELPPQIEPTEELSVPDNLARDDKGNVLTGADGKPLYMNDVNIDNPNESTGVINSLLTSDPIDTSLEERLAKNIKKVSSANIMSILFPQRARDIVKEYF